MKNNIKLAIMIFITLSFCVFLFTACSLNPQPLALAESCVRIHIRANSNSDEDQTVKLAVRDEVTAYLTTVLAPCSSKTEAMDTLAREESNLVAVANNTLRGRGFLYGASIRLNNEFFPAKDYDSYTFPEGYYDALTISLGTGEGNNWWCVAFPPLCFVPDSKDGEKIVYKSWVKEKLDKLFG